MLYVFEMFTVTHLGEFWIGLKAVTCLASALSLHNWAGCRMWPSYRWRIFYLFQNLNLNFVIQITNHFSLLEFASSSSTSSTCNINSWLLAELLSISNIPFYFKSPTSTVFSISQLQYFFYFFLPPSSQYLSRIGRVSHSKNCNHRWNILSSQENVKTAPSSLVEGRMPTTNYHPMPLFTSLNFTYVQLYQLWLINIHFDFLGLQVNCFTLTTLIHFPL